MNASDPVKAAVAAHWNRRAPTFDSDFGHSIATADERAAWDRILRLIAGGRAGLDALDVGCGTGFLSFELAASGHRATGIDFAASMLEAARKKRRIAAPRSGSSRATPKTRPSLRTALISSSAVTCCGLCRIPRRLSPSGCACCGPVAASPYSTASSIRAC